MAVTKEQEQEVNNAVGAQATEDDAQNQPMEVVVADDGAAEVETEAKVTPEKKPAAQQTDLERVNRQPPKRATNQFGRLRGEARAASEVAQRLYEENQRLKADLAGLSNAGMVNYERSLIAEQKLAQRTLEEAIKGGDAAAQAAAQQDVARIAAEKRDVDAWRGQNPQPKPGDQPRQAQPQAQPQQQPRQPELNDAAKDWVGNNPWFDERNEDYDEDMHEETVEYARLLEARMKRQGKSAEINTTKYFEDIETHLRATFPDRWGEEEEPHPAPKPRQSSVAGAVRSAPQNNGTKNGTKVSLTADEVGLVRKMVGSNSVHYPADHPDPDKRGRAKTFEEAINDFALRKRAMASQPQQQR